MQREALDKDWFEIYKDGCAFDDIDYIKFDQAKMARQKELFLAGLIDEPTLKYNVDIQAVSHHKTKLLELQEIVSSDNSAHLAVKKAYALKIESQLHKVSLLEAIVRQGDKTVTEASKQIYGAPDEEIMRRALAATLYVAERHNFALSEKWNDLADYFEVEADGSDIEYKPSDVQNYLTIDELVEFFKKALVEKNIPWQVQVDSTVLVITLSYGRKSVLIPETRKVTKTEAGALVEHEINVHLARHYNGLKSPLLLLSVGLGQYLKGEEGLATYRQSFIDKSMPGTINYFNTCLIMGLYPKQKFNFRQIFNLSKEYYEMLGVSKERILDESWKRCMRTFRGTTGQSAGEAFTRDLIYFSGYLGVKDLIESPDPEVERFLVGKYDPTNQDHIDILNQLDIL
ncbi:MAG: DUF1704 domain-containing protein [Candidatus Nomurabacteria bacterium]|nr:DUF1704 domain-containing protein [Candidatus Nomurabacteria bacterium]USN88174.1 MAG: DUF1704 domain-containing protein [Candidatus Nomurabacteria bacterium]